MYTPDNIPYLLDGAQKIYLPSDILNSKHPHGMCVETTAIMASAVESLGMRPYFVIVPGHAYLGVALSTTATGPSQFWETSLLGAQGGQLFGDQANVFGNSEYSLDVNENRIQYVVDVQTEQEQGINPIE